MEFLKYFEKHWYPRFESGQISYSNKEGVHRSNSVVESYNSYIKNNLPRAPNWPQFYEFIKQEDKKYFENAILAELKSRINDKSKNFGKGFKQIGTKKRKKPCERTPTPKKTESQNIMQKSQEISFSNIKSSNSLSRLSSDLKKVKLTPNLPQIEIPWIQWSQNSCRYDSFLTLFALGLFHKFKNSFHPKLVKGRSIQATDYRKLSQTIKKLKKKEFNERFNYWNWRYSNGLDSEPVGNDGTIVKSCFCVFGTHSFGPTL